MPPSTLRRPALFTGVCARVSTVKISTDRDHAFHPRRRAVQIIRKMRSDKVQAEDEEASVPPPPKKNKKIALHTFLIFSQREDLWLVLSGLLLPLSLPPRANPTRAQMWNFQDEYEDMKNIHDPLEGDVHGKKKKKKHGGGRERAQG